MAAGHSDSLPQAVTSVNTMIHTTLAGIEPTTSRLLVRRATSSASCCYRLYADSQAVSTPRCKEVCNEQTQLSK